MFNFSETQLSTPAAVRLRNMEMEYAFSEISVESFIEFLIALKAWTIKGCKGEEFNTRYGLCKNYSNWMINLKPNGDKVNIEWMVHRYLFQIFNTTKRDDGITRNPNTPFDESYSTQSAAGLHYKNAERLAFIDQFLVEFA